MTDDPIGAALHADAEAAREEIRDAGLTCPSCGQNYADLITGHCLILIMAAERKVEAECRDGQRAECVTWDDMRAAANISLADEVWRQETIAFARDVIGTGPGDFTGLLSLVLCILGARDATRGRSRWPMSRSSS